MAMHAAMPYELKTNKTILTFVLPLDYDCNLKCPFCYIRHRKEQTNKNRLTSRNFLEFLADCASSLDIGAFCIQGHEPLLPSSFQNTDALLSLSHNLGLPASIITNGTFLADRVGRLRRLSLSRIAVSLDSHLPECHDRSRGVLGTFEKVVEGLRHAINFPEFYDIIGVASVLIPKKREQLMGMPALLANIGIKRWTVTCLFKVGKGDAVGRPVGDRASTFRDLLVLQREAEKHGIEMTVDDEFGRLSEEDMNRDVVDINRLRIHRLQRPSGVFRLMPDGRCSIGTELLQEVAEDTPRWIPGEEHAADFLQRVRDRYAAKRRAAAA